MKQVTFYFRNVGKEKYVNQTNDRLWSKNQKKGLKIPDDDTILCDLNNMD